MNRMSRAHAWRRPLPSILVGLILGGLCVVGTACDFARQKTCDAEETSALRSPSATLASPTPKFAGDFGRAVAKIDDVNGDGTDDVAVGTHDEAIGDTDSAGRAYLFPARSE